MGRHLLTEDNIPNWIIRDLQQFLALAKPKAKSSLPNWPEAKWILFEYE
jgi:hypothetical protein